MPLQDAWRNFGPRTGTARDEAPKLRFAEVSKSNSGCYVGRNITFTPICVTLNKISTYFALRKWIGHIRFTFGNLLFKIQPCSTF